jgi:DNA invertase Pin-like site-specific DNA recombinase
MGHGNGRRESGRVVRVSRVGPLEGDNFISPDLQREQIERVARREGLELVDVIQELDASGGDATRPGWNRAIEMVERGEVSGIAVWNFARFNRSVKDAVNALDRIEGAGGHVWSATEDRGDSSAGRMMRTILLAVAENERTRAAEGFRAARTSAVERGLHMAGRVPLGYRRGPDRRLEPDPDTAPIAQGVFERAAEGWSAHAIARWVREQGTDFTNTGVRYMLQNRTYRGEVRSGDLMKESAHTALVSEGLWRKCQGRQLKSQRTGRLAQCANCGRGLRLSTGGNNHRPFYYCRHRHCTERADAVANELDSFLLNTLDEELNPADPSQWVALPGGDSHEVEEAEAARDAAREDLDSFLADTRLRRALGAARHAEAAENYVAVLDKCETDLAEVKERHAGRYELAGRLWNTDWGHAERYEWVSRMVRRVVVSRGREPLSRRAEVELRWGHRLNPRLDARRRVAPRAQKRAYRSARRGEVTKG